MNEKRKQNKKVGEIETDAPTSQKSNTNPIKLNQEEIDRVRPK